MARPNFLSSLMGANERVPNYIPDPLDPSGTGALDGGPLNVVDRLVDAGVMKPGELICGDHASWRYAGWPDFSEEEQAALELDTQALADDAYRQLHEIEEQRLGS